MYKKLFVAILFMAVMAANVMAQDDNKERRRPRNLDRLEEPPKIAPNSILITPPHLTKPTDDVITLSVRNVSFDMVRVKLGSFDMGCDNSQDNDCFDRETPSHFVMIDYDYYIGKFEVTQELYEAVMGNNPSGWKAPDRPVEDVSWDDIQLFCKELSILTGYVFSLPTEAEWEYAARGGHMATASKYSGSMNVDVVAWHSGNSGGQTHPVGSRQPNELGIYDMSGNVWEWCQDWYGKYSGNRQTNPKGPTEGTQRVLRGGAWDSNTEGCRVVKRRPSSQNIHNKGIGFRVVLR